jgi:hypothetical protein
MRDIHKKFFSIECATFLLKLEPLLVPTWFPEQLNCGANNTVSNGTEGLSGRSGKAVMDDEIEERNK